MFKKSELVHFFSRSKQIGNFLQEFENVALPASIQNTLSYLWFFTSSSLNPKYSCLLLLRQLRGLEIGFSCELGCYLTVDGDVITVLAQAIPKLGTLKLCHAPCNAPTGTTVNVLIIFASHCLCLSRLRTHYQSYSLVDAAMSVEPEFPSTLRPRECCDLTCLEVGRNPIPRGRLQCSR